MPAGRHLYCLLNAGCVEADQSLDEVEGVHSF